MKVEVGDWVRLRGMKRIYEVQSVHEQQNPDQSYIRLVGGLSAGALVLNIEARAEKCWIKKADQAK